MLRPLCSLAISGGQHPGAFGALAGKSFAGMTRVKLDKDGHIGLPDVSSL